MSSSKKTRLPVFSVTQMILIIAILAAMVFVLGLNAGGVSGGSMSASEASLSTRVAQEESRNEQLVLTLTYVYSDVYVEDYARNEAGMLLPGEKRVVPLIQSGPAVPTPVPSSILAQSAASTPLEAWWTLFFDSPLPGR